MGCWRRKGLVRCLAAEGTPRWRAYLRIIILIPKGRPRTVFSLLGWKDRRIWREGLDGRKVDIRRTPPPTAAAIMEALLLVSVAGLWEVLELGVWGRIRG